MNIKQILFLFFALCFLSSCASEQTVYSPKQYGPGTTVAVWEIEDLSVTVNPLLTDMKDFFSDTIINTLAEHGKFKVIERQKLALALTELNLGSSELASEENRLKIGQILGAQLMVFGGYQMLGEQLRFDLRMVEVESGVVINTAEHSVHSADMAGWIKASQDAATKLVKKEKQPTE